ncbi:MAG: ATP-binding cassette domain-containing protein [Flavobacteriales bacterium]|nr:ATP-binding cassette domain-containing protein [Flavobacteriales bacterium]
MSQEVLVSAQGLSKKFCKDLRTSLRYGVIDVAGELFGRTPDGMLRNKEFWAIDGVDFELRRGECLGLIGRNGAGKTTLLRMLNGLIKPDRGSITMKGRVGALIALGAGFNPILTGRENIYVNGAVLGLSKAEINARFEEIISFADLSDFIDAPVQSYSSGMQVRLGFAVASTLDPDVLLIDEALAVGDVQFRSKCYDRIRELQQRTAIIFVSHHRGDLARICDQGLLLTKGRVSYKGSIEDALNAYDEEAASGSGPVRMAHEPVRSASVELGADEIAWGSDLVARITLESDATIEDAYFRFTIMDEGDECVGEWRSHHHGPYVTVPAGTSTWEHRMSSIKLARGTYRLNFVLGAKRAAEYLVLHYNFTQLTVTGDVVGLSRYQI